MFGMRSLAGLMGEVRQLYRRACVSMPMRLPRALTSGQPSVRPSYMHAHWTDMTHLVDEAGSGPFTRHDTCIIHAQVVGH